MGRRFFLSRMRLQLLALWMFLIWAIVMARLVQIQLIDGEAYAEITRIQSKGEIVVPAERGRLIDSHGRILATNLACTSIFAYPQSRSDASRIAATVAPVISTPISKLRAKLTGNLETFQWIGRKLPDELAAKLEGKDIPGLFTQKEMRRSYTTNGLGQDLIGSVNIDNQGISGLEYAIDDKLAGRNGRALIERDAIGKVYRVSSREIVEPINGCDVTLTIDLDWQAVVEAELAEGVSRFSARSGLAVFIKPNDGAILAMASCCPGQGQARSLKNEAISDLFEPGSVFKLITAAALLEEGVLQPDDTIFCDSGRAVFSGRIVRDDKEWGQLRFRDIFRFSSNIGMGKAAVRLGGRGLHKYVRDFGFGTRSGIDLPGEAPGRVREPEVWSDHYTACLAMGHGLSVNTLQLAAAFSVVPSQGTLYRPYIIKEIAAPDGKLLEVSEPQAVRRLLSRETCEVLGDFLAAVVDSGTAKYSKSRVISFSGKTGTAQKPNLETGGYYQNRFVSTFAGYFPREDPIAVGVVVLDDAQPLHYAGMTAAKIFAGIAERMASLKNLPAPRQVMAHDTTGAAELIEVPLVVGCDADSVQLLLGQLDLDVRAVNSGRIVARQHPRAGTRLAAGERLILYFTDDDTVAEENLSKIVGLSVRQAVAELLNRGYEVDLRGSGLVRSVKEIGASTDGARKRCQIICSRD